MTRTWHRGRNEARRDAHSYPTRKQPSQDPDWAVPVPCAPWQGQSPFSTSPPHTPPTMAAGGGGEGSVLPSTCTWDLLIKLALKSMHQAQD